MGNRLPTIPTRTHPPEDEHDETSTKADQHSETHGRPERHVAGQQRNEHADNYAEHGTLPPRDASASLTGFCHAEHPTESDGGAGR